MAEFEEGPEHERIRENFPSFKVEHLDEGDALITCPEVDGRCGNGAIVNYRLWVLQNKHKKTRACTYCFKASRIPEDV
jgi:hypothetical protein